MGQTGVKMSTGQIYRPPLGQTGVKMSTCSPSQKLPGIRYLVVTHYSITFSVFYTKISNLSGMGTIHKLEINFSRHYL